MLLNFGKALSSNSYNEGAGVIAYGGTQATSGDRISSTPAKNLNPTSPTYYQFVGSGQASGLYGQALSNGNALVSGQYLSRDVVITFFGPTSTLAGVATTEIPAPVAGPFLMPFMTISGSAISYPSGFSRVSGTPIATAITGEYYGLDYAATGVGDYVAGSGGKNPASGHYTTR
jgi:hypothetical protein